MAGTRVEQHLRAGGRQHRPRLGVLLAALGLALLAVVGLASDRPLWDIGGPPELISPRSYAGDLMLIVFGLVVVSPLLISAIRRRRRRGRVPEDEPDVPPRKVPWWGRVIAVAAVLLTILVALLVIRMLPGSGSSGGRATSQLPLQGLRGGHPVPPVKPTPPAVHWWGYAGLVLVLLASVATYWRLRRTETSVWSEAPKPDENAELFEALDLSLDDLETDPDARRAVIRAYARMERALGANGLARAPSETALEYLARALASLRVGRQSVTRLTALYERAKFSSHEVDGSMKADAIAALSSLREELASLHDQPSGAAA